MSARTATVQELLENQCASVLFMVNEVTGEVTPLAAPVEEKPARKGRPRREVSYDTPAASEGEGE